MRKRLFQIIEASNGTDKLSLMYDYFMIVVIFVSLIPLVFKQSNKAFEMIDAICVTVFIIDYVLRLVTADYKYRNKTNKNIAFIKYPFSMMAIADLLAILPSIIPLNTGFKLFKLVRMFRAFRVFRVLKGFRYSKNIQVIASVLRETKDSLLAVLTLALMYILITALVIYNVEPDSFKSFFDAIYWATVSLTTVGYGDIYPVSTIGRIITMVSSMFGIAVVALPAGIITAGYMSEIEKNKENNE